MTTWCSFGENRYGFRIWGQGGATRALAVHSVQVTAAWVWRKTTLRRIGVGVYEVIPAVIDSSGMRYFVFTRSGARLLVRHGWKVDDLFTTCTPRKGSPLRKEWRAA